VIKNIAYFPSQCARNSGPVIDAFLDSCGIANITTVENSMTADAVVIWSVLWHGRMSANRQVYEHYRSQNKPVIVIDVGALRRGHTWKIAVNNINALGHYGHQENLDWDRPKKLGISLGATMVGNPAVLICLQHEHSLQLQGIDQQAWLIDQIKQLRQHTDRPILVRPHPRNQITLPTDIVVETPQKLAHTYDSYDLRFDYQALINYNSGPGIQAGIEGCPVIVDQSSLAHPISITINEIEQRPMVDRVQWLVEICHSEYTVDEIRTAKWLTRLAPYL
jgi:hypothetical protein